MLAKISKSPLLIFGCLPPVDPITSSFTVQAALFMQSFSDVIVVIDDAAPPPKEEAIPYLRESTLKQTAANYAQSPRLFILGNSFESLWAIEWLKDFPGALILTDLSMHNLWRLYAETLPSWPKCYTDWVEAMLPASTASTICHTLLNFQRESSSFKIELPANSVFEEMASSLVTLDLPLVALSSDIVANDDKPTLVCVTNETSKDTVLLALGALAETGHTIEHHILSGNEAILADAIQSADIIAILDETPTAPPAASLALGFGKAIICAGPWTDALPQHAAIKLPKTDALHSLTAAIGALGDTRTRSWLSNEAESYFKTFKYDEKAKAAVLDILAIPTVPLNIPIIPQPENVITQEGASSQLSGQVAFIGAVPAAGPLKSQHPHLDYDNSPRFATPALADRLANESGTPASIVLAELGYESILVSDDNFGTPWHAIKPDLKVAMPAYSFGCDVKDATKVCDVNIPSTLEIIFPTLTLKRKKQKPRGFIEETGCFWQLDSIHNRVRCLLMAGSRNPFQVRAISDDNYLFLITANHTTAYVGGHDNKATELRPDMMALLTFNIALANPKTGRHMPVTELVNALGTTKLVMETLHQASESEKVRL